MYTLEIAIEEFKSITGSTNPLRDNVTELLKYYEIESMKRNFQEHKKSIDTLVSALEKLGQKLGQ